ncbi:MAG: hypothetical protein LBR92_01965 [Puniceicoccales bacterium]|nr:hypothetical protein [Puniceicoccales bacterium]
MNRILGMQKDHAKHRASWVYASFASGSSKTYVGNDTVAKNDDQVFYNELTSRGHNKLSNWNSLKQDSVPRDRHD